MIQITALKAAVTLHDVAALLHFKPAALAYVVFKLDSARKYKKFSIPKRNGGSRQICAPLPELKLLQRRLSDLLQNCVEEINEANGRDDRIAHGFKRKRSIITNAWEHRNRKHVFNVDLENFFGAINFGRIRGFFIKDKNFSLHEAVATLLAQIASHENGLPQGSPCSPVVSNLIGHVLDIHLVRLASKTGCTYSRYADDLTFSTNKPEFPRCIAERAKHEEHKWVPGSELTRLVKKSGFELNQLKTRMQYRDSRQEVTGLVVNKKINVRSEYRHTVRAMVHRLFTTGNFEFVHKLTDVKGNAIVVKTTGTSNQLHGMLGFIDGVELYNKARDLEGTRAKEKSSPTNKKWAYRHFLLFKEFYTAQAPVIICEGKTDNVYILHAIRSLAAAFPQLATIDPDGKIRLNVRIYKYSGTSTGRILRIHGGTADLGRLMRDYHSEIARFKAPGKQHPIVILIDNDSGASPLYNTIKEVTGKKPTGTEAFVHVTGNLYLTATPLTSGISPSMIEDFFDASVKTTVVGSKTFDVNCGDTNNATHYGKMVFAHKVVRPKADTINFSGFNTILSNIVSIIDAHAKTHPQAVHTP